MAGRQPEPHQRPSIAAIAASLLLACWATGPANAAPSVNPQCDNAADPSLDIPMHELSANIVSDDASAPESKAEPSQAVLSPANYLVPRAEAAARRAFSEKGAPLADAVPPVSREVTTPRTDDADAEPAVNARIPGVSADDLARYRRQMYRTDI